jgi:zinc transport system substrate-binding protein
MNVFAPTVGSGAPRSTKWRRSAKPRHTRTSRHSMSLAGVLVAGLLMASGCGAGSDAPSGNAGSGVGFGVEADLLRDDAAQALEHLQELRTVASIPPLLWGFRALVHAPAGALPGRLLLDPGESPHDASLTPSRARAMAEADLVLLVGWGFEPALERALSSQRDTPASRETARSVFRMSEALNEAGLTPPSLLVDAASSEAHAHGSDAHDAHGHGLLDPHAWLDPEAMAIWVQALAAHLEIPEAFVRPVLAEIEAVDAEYRAALASVSTRALVTHHEGFGWLARRYGLEVVAVLRPEGVVETRPGDLARAAEAIRTHGLGVIFSERQLGDRAAQRLESLTGVRILMLDPLGDGDWPAMMRANLAILVEGLNTPAPGRVTP